MLDLKLGDALEGVSSSDYTPLRFRVFHPAADALRDPLKEAYVPVEYQNARNSELVVRTMLMPDTATRFDDADGKSTIGERYYFAAATGISLVRTRNKGLNVTTSSDYDKSVAASFDYGILFVTEPWNFSENAPWIPIFAPQLTAGVLGPTTFTNSAWWKGFSGVFGLNFRLPAANKPTSSTVEAQSGIVLWYEVTAGARDSVIQSLLFGLNVKVGALAP